MMLVESFGPHTGIIWQMQLDLTVTVTLSRMSSRSPEEGAFTAWISSKVGVAAEFRPPHLNQTMCIFTFLFAERWSLPLMAAKTAPTAASASSIKMFAFMTNSIRS
jgi:hypothetical protein